MLRIGIDVGGTNCDAVLLDGDRLIASTKTLTTPDVTDCITTALGNLQSASGFDPAQIAAVMIGTTHFINALLEGKHLERTAAIRFALPATAALPPLVDWPQPLLDTIGELSYLCHGGFEYDGRQAAPFDEAEFRACVDSALNAGAQSFAISSMFSPVNAEFEMRAAEILAAEVPDLPVSLSHEIGRIGLLGRENATIINATLRPLAARVTNSLESTIRAVGITGPLFVSQNDGTLMDVDYVARYPVATFASGATNSMRGAAFLTGVDNCIVIDVGGTSSDAGFVSDGYPREANQAVQIAGVQTNFRIPDLLSIGIGGGSRIVPGEGPVGIGPSSVASRLLQEGRVFGGNTLTATDIAVASGRVALGDPNAVADLPAGLVREVMSSIADSMDRLVDRMRTSPEPVLVVAVGGGSFLVPDAMDSASAVIRPEDAAVANAIGAAMGEIGGEVDHIVATGQRTSAVDTAKQEAVDRAVAAGARPGTVRIHEVEETPLAYLPGNASRIRVKAIGELGLGGHNA